MVSARIVSFITGLAYLITFADPAIAEPVDWASSGGDLFVTAGLPDVQTAANIERLISLPVVPDQMTRRLAQPRPSVERQRSDAASSADPQPTEDYSEVRLLPSNQPLDELITKIATETGLDPKLLHALVIIESAYNTRAVSPVGARGLTQLMPGTAAELGVRDVFNNEQNLRAGARYLPSKSGGSVIYGLLSPPITRDQTASHVWAACQILPKPKITSATASIVTSPSPQDEASATAANAAREGDRQWRNANLIRHWRGNWICLAFYPYQFKCNPKRHESK
jgi:Transglycosylase SLT domain